MLHRIPIEKALKNPYLFIYVNSDCPRHQKYCGWPFSCIQKYYNLSERESYKIRACTCEICAGLGFTNEHFFVLDEEQSEASFICPACVSNSHPEP